MVGVAARGRFGPGAERGHDQSWVTVSPANLFHRGTAKTRRAIPLLVLVVLSTSASQAQNNRDRFQLYAGCTPVQLDIQGDMSQLGIDTASVRRAVTGRLKAARIYSDEAVNTLRVETQVISQAFIVQADFHKPVLDQWTNLTRMAPTWSAGRMGTHGGDRTGVLGRISFVVDRFISEYLRVNADACEERARTGRLVPAVRPATRSAYQELPRLSFVPLGKILPAIPPIASWHYCCSIVGSEGASSWMRQRCCETRTTWVNERSHAPLLFFVLLALHHTPLTLQKEFINARGNTYNLLSQEVPVHTTMSI